MPKPFAAPFSHPLEHKGDKGENTPAFLKGEALLPSPRQRADERGQPGPGQDSCSELQQIFLGLQEQEFSSAFQPWT